jgi:type I restriction enzyme S subunit
VNVQALPDGWVRSTLGEVASVIRNGTFAARPDDNSSGTPILRISAVRSGVVNTADVKYVHGLGKSLIDQFTLNNGDLLFTRYNGSRHLVGVCGVVPQHSGTILHPDKLIRVVIPSDIADGRFIAHQMASGPVRGHLEPRIRTTAGQSGISGADIKSIPLILPPLAEQRRIVEILEDHLSRLDAAKVGLDQADARVRVLRDQFIRTELFPSPGDGDASAALPPSADAIDDVVPVLTASWRWARLEELADVVGGITKDSGKQGDPTFVEVPYLRVANVQRGRLDLRVVTTIRAPATKATALTLKPGDVLLNEGGDRDKLGRGWVWEGQIDDCIHQNHVFRARIRDDALRPRLLSWAANSVGGQWCERNGKQSVNLASISLSKIRRMPIPVPPVADQAPIEARILSCLDSCARLQQSIERVRRESRSLRRALLAAAFSGDLTGDSTSVDHIKELTGV